MKLKDESYTKDNRVNVGHYSVRSLLKVPQGSNLEPPCKGTEQLSVTIHHSLFSA